MAWDTASNVAKEIVSFAGEQGVEKGVEKMAGAVAGKAAGVAVAPAIWVVKAIAGQGGPSVVDVGLWAGGIAFSVPALITGVAKAVFDTETDRRVKLAAASEPLEVRDGIKPCADYGSAGHRINATNVAADGGTAWLASSDVWVYIVDAKGRLVFDYVPKVAKQIYQPNIPLSPTGNGRFQWHSIQGGA